MTPHVGQVVRVRSRQYLVEDVVPPPAAALGIFLRALASRRSRVQDARGAAGAGAGAGVGAVGAIGGGAAAAAAAGTGAATGASLSAVGAGLAAMGLAAVAAAAAPIREFLRPPSSAANDNCQPLERGRTRCRLVRDPKNPQHLLSDGSGPHALRCLYNCDGRYQSFIFYDAASCPESVTYW
jgi:hypothetical protein